jgi:hypothetical protein
MSEAVSLSSRAVNHITSDALNITETLSNLTFLMRLDAESPNLVRKYLEEAEERLRALSALLSSAEARHANS